MNFNGRTVVVVGPGGTLKNSGLGRKIDSFDIVIRVNYCPIKGFEKDVGTKQTIWCSSRSRWHWISLDKNHPKNKMEQWGFHHYNDKDKKNVLKKVKEVWYVAGHKNGYESFDIEKWGNKEFSPLIYNSKKNHFREIKHRLGEVDKGHATTGIALLYLLIHMLDKVYLAGFDCKGRFMCEGKKFGYNHYYDPKNRRVKLPMQHNQNAHEYDREYTWMKSLMIDDRIRMLTNYTNPETSYLLKRPEYYVCKHCGKPFHKYYWHVDRCPICLKRL